MSSRELRIDSFISKEIFAPRHKSVKNLEEVSIQFINNSHYIVDLCWIDFRGNLVRYSKLGPHEVVKLTTFIGHCWIARFIRNGTAAQFLPDRTEVLFITRRFPPTAVVFIIQKVPTLFEAVVEHIGELFYDQQYALFKIPVPKLVKVYLFYLEFI
ncbi:von Hippel-Lindau disease tumor suppressor family protein [Acanthocheilonema viteae]